MRLPKSIVGAVLRFVVIFGLLVAPWPGWNDFYGSYFRMLGQWAFADPEGQRIVRFEPHHLQHGLSSLDTQMTLGNRALVDASGKGMAELIDLDTRSLGWMPTAFTLALILATPISCRRRAWALIGGLVLIHAFIIFSVQVRIWDESPSVSLFTLTPFWKTIVDELDYTLMTQMGASFSVPILIWILVTIRREQPLLSFPLNDEGRGKTVPKSTRGLASAV